MNTLTEAKKEKKVVHPLFVTGEKERKDSALMGMQLGDVFGEQTKHHSFQEVKSLHGTWGADLPCTPEITPHSLLAMHMAKELPSKLESHPKSHSDLKEALTEIFVSWLTETDAGEADFMEDEEIAPLRKLSDGLGGKLAAGKHASTYPLFRAGLLPFMKDGKGKSLSIDYLTEIAHTSTLLTTSSAESVYAAEIFAKIVQDLKTHKTAYANVIPRALDIATNSLSQPPHPIISNMLGLNEEEAAAYHFAGWSQVIYSLRQAKEARETMEADEFFVIDPAYAVHPPTEVGLDEFLQDETTVTVQPPKPVQGAAEVLSASLLIASALGEDATLALRRASMLTGDSHSVSVLTGILSGTDGFTWPKKWKLLIEVAAESSLPNYPFMIAV